MSFELLLIIVLCLVWIVCVLWLGLVSFFGLLFGGVVGYVVVYLGSVVVMGEGIMGVVIGVLVVVVIGLMVMVGVCVC